MGLFNEIEKIDEEIDAIIAEGELFDKDDFLRFVVSAEDSDDLVNYFQGFATKSLVSKYGCKWNDKTGRFEQEYDNFNIYLHLQ